MIVWDSLSQWYNSNCSNSSAHNECTKLLNNLKNNVQSFLVWKWMSTLLICLNWYEDYLFGKRQSLR